MKKGTRVMWTLKTGVIGKGTTIADEDNGHVLVAIDPAGGEEFHLVIFCTVTWLTEVHA